MITKKEIPNIIRLKIDYDPEAFEGLMLLRYNRIIKEGHTFANHDFHLYCAILIRMIEIEKLPESYKEHIIINGKIKEEIHFNVLRLQSQLNEPMTQEDNTFFIHKMLDRARAKKKIAKEEIKRTSVNPNKITLHNSQYYRELLKLIGEFDDLTLVDWFVPIVLEYKTYVHILVKHAEETMFGKGQFKKGPFFHISTMIFLLF